MAENVSAKCLAQGRLRQGGHVEREALRQGGALASDIHVHCICKPAIQRWWPSKVSQIVLRVRFTGSREVDTVIPPVTVHATRISILPGGYAVSVTLAVVIIETLPEFGVGVSAGACGLERQDIPLNARRAVVGKFVGLDQK